MAFQPMPLSRKPAPFDHPEWIFELKYDGFRSLAVIHNGRRYVDHIERNGTALFQRVCEMDLEGILAKHSLAPYTTERTTWFKIKNRNYSQMAGREELFDRERHNEPVAGRHTCDLACAEAE